MWVDGLLALKGRELTCSTVYSTILVPCAGHCCELKGESVTQQPSVLTHPLLDGLVARPFSLLDASVSIAIVPMLEAINRRL